MYQPSEKFITELNKTSRIFKARITSGNDVLKEEIKTILLTMGSCGADTFTIGSVFASYADITLSATNVSLAGKEILIEFGLILPDETIDYIPMGYYTVSPAEVAKARDMITLKATDRISSKCGGVYIPTVTFPCSIKAVLDDIEKQAGITIETSLPTAGIIQTAMTGLLHREVLGYIASLLGGFCYADRDGKIQIAAYPSTSSLEIKAERFYDIQTAEDKYSVDALTVIVSEGGEDADGNTVEGVSYTEGSGTGIAVSNPYMTADLFSAMKNRVLNYSFYPGTAQFLGDPRLGPEDAIAAMNYAGDKFLLPCMSLIHDYDGGLTTTITTPGQAVSEQAQGPLTQQVERLSTEMVLAKEVIAKKLSVDEADIKYATIQKANILEASITTVAGDLANYKVMVADEFKSAYAEITTVKGDLATFKTGDFENLRARQADFETATAENFAAANAQIKVVSGDLANYKTVIAGELATAKGWMLEGAIGSAQISDLDVTKLNAGVLDTAIINLAGTDGKLQIIDNTIQISDDDRVRVQIGKDDSGDYTLAVWDSSGKLIWDALGATENTIQRKIIRDQMVADDANIQGYKLDINSVVTSINGATTKIDGTVVQVGNKTLNIALSEQETAITEQGETISKQAAEIKANEESIKLKVDSQTYAEDKKAIESSLSKATSDISILQNQIALKVEQADINKSLEGYSTTLQMEAAITAAKDEINLSVSNTYVKQDDLNGVETRLSSAEQKLTKDGITTIVGDYYVTDSDLTAIKNRITNAESTISQHSQEIALTVKKDGIISAINQTAETVKISASKINLDGYITATNLKNDGATIISGGKLTCTNIVATGGIIGGWNITSSGLNRTWTDSSNKDHWMYFDTATNNPEYAAYMVRTKDHSTSTWNNMFLVTWNGRMYAKNAEIEGKIKSTDAEGYISTTIDNGSILLTTGAESYCSVSGQGIRFPSAPGNSYSYLDIIGQEGITVREGGITAPRISCGYDPTYDNSIGCSNWFRSSGSTGWYNATYGGGIYMTDSTWVKVFNGKCFWCNSIARAVTLQAGDTATNGGLELYHSTPFIDFHHNRDSGDYTHRIIADNSSRLHITGKNGTCHLRVEGDLTCAGAFRSTGRMTADEHLLFSSNGRGVYGKHTDGSNNIRIAIASTSNSGAGGNAVNCTIHGDGSYRGYLVGASLYSNHAITNYSDERLKENFQKLDDRYLTMFDNMSPELFNWKIISEDKRRQIGYVAQKILRAMDIAGISEEENSIVNRCEDIDNLENGEILTLDYNGLSVITAYALKDTRTTVKKHENDIEDVKKKYMEIMNENILLKAQIESLQQQINHSAA